MANRGYLNPRASPRAHPAPTIRAMKFKPVHGISTLLGENSLPHTTRKATNWGKTRGWHSHSIACWDSEWAEYRKAAELAGKSTNAWIRDGLKEIVRYERVAREDREDSGGIRDPGE